MKKILAGLVLSTLQMVAFGESNRPTYTVPAPPELQSVATNPILRMKISADEISYDLPPQLVGENARPIVLKRIPTNTALKTFKGPEGEASCHRSDDLNCFVLYFNVSGYETAARKYL